MVSAKSISEVLGLRQGPGLDAQEQQALLKRFPFFTLLPALPEGRAPQGFHGTATLPNPVLLERLRQPYTAPAVTAAAPEIETPAQPAEDQDGILTHLPPSEESSKSVEEEKAEEPAQPEETAETPDEPETTNDTATKTNDEPEATGNATTEEAPAAEPKAAEASPTEATPAAAPITEEKPQAETLPDSEAAALPQPDSTPRPGDTRPGIPPLSLSASEMASEIPTPPFLQDYFQHEGIEINGYLPGKPEAKEEEHEYDLQQEQALMVMRSFTEWLLFYRKKSQQEQEEEAAKRSLKAAWQKEKLVAALGEEDEEIPQAVFEMAVDSISSKGIASESLAAIYARQGKVEKARAMYQKLSEQNPEKSSYFAGLIQKLDDAEADRP